MKKIYLLLAVCLISVSLVQAQRKIGNAIKKVKPLSKTSGFTTNGVEAGSCDTINYPNPSNWNLTLYGTNNGGFVSGINEYGDLQKANYFDLSATINSYIVGSAFRFAVANSSNESDLSKFVYFRVYGDDNGFPGLEIGSPDSLPLSALKTDVDNGFTTAINFTSPLTLPASKKFYVSVDFSNFSLSNGDSIALVSTSQDDLAAGTGTAWEQNSDLSWHNFNNTDSSWGFDAELVILPFVSTATGSCGTLAVKLISFDAERKNKDAIINWKVAEELNMKGYQLEKAGNDNNYKSVTFIPAHNDLKNNFYSYTDANAFANSSTVQYRLKQIDNDGKVEYSKIISLKAGSAFNNVTFANPFNGSLHMQLNLSNQAQVKINVYDMKGSLVGTEKPASYAASSNSIDLKSTSGLKSGMYFIKLMVGSEEFTYKVMKQ